MKLSIYNYGRFKGDRGRRWEGRGGGNDNPEGKKETGESGGSRGEGQKNLRGVKMEEKGKDIYMGGGGGNKADSLEPLDF